MRITIIYDNTAFRKDLQADWGFAALIEVENTPRILFDTGANGKILLNNMEKLGIEPDLIDEVFISHDHYDHTGGLKEFLKRNKEVKIYVPLSFKSIRSKNIIVIKEPVKIHENIFSTGELEEIEQSLGIITNQGIVLIVGCSHPYMGNILNAAKQFGGIYPHTKRGESTRGAKIGEASPRYGVGVYAVIGGMHGFSEFELFKDLKLICPTHCTRRQTELKELYPQKYISGGAGKIIEINNQ